ncbi:MAG: phosphatase PAP2 family protein [Patescibacteria group bacterium]
MAFDGALFGIFHKLLGVSGILDVLFVFLSKYLAYIVCIAVVIFLLLHKNLKERFYMFFFVVLSLIFSRGILTEVIRYFYLKQRPFESLGFVPLLEESSHSFPSGHAAFFFALAFALWLFDKKWGKWVFVFAIVNGCARIIAGVHWPLDIIGGFVVGGVSVYLVYLLLNPYKPKGVAQEKQVNTNE